MQGFTSICTHFVIFLTQKPKQRSKDQKQVRVDLQGMNTSLTCLHLSLHFKVKNTQKRTLQIHISRKSEVYIGHAYRETRAHAHTRTHAHTHTRTHTHTHTHTCLVQCVSVQQVSHDVKQYVADPGRSNPQVDPSRDPHRQETHPELMPSLKQELQDMNKEKYVCDWNLSIKYK